ncbi:MAG: DUF4349 domain-containing protein [Myxococcota bacterium]
MNRTLFLASCLLVLLVAPGCAGTSLARSAPTARLEDASSPWTPDGGVTQETAFLVKTAFLRVEVDALPMARNEAIEIVEAAGGRVDRSSANGEDRFELGLRVPVDGLESALDRFAALGKVLDRHVSTEDVTGQVIDLDARIANLVALRDRMRGLLAKASRIEDILAIEKELTRVQSELDSLTGRVERLREDAALSQTTLTLDQREPERILGPVGFVGYWTWAAVEKLFVIRHGPN